MAIDIDATTVETRGCLEGPERQKVLVDWNNTAASLPTDRCVHELIAEQARRRPSATIEDLTGQSLTYAELEARAARLARHLQALGVGRGGLVAVAVDRSLEMIVAVLAVLKAGGAYVPLDPAYPRERLALMLDDAQPLVVLTKESLLARLPHRHGQIVCLDRDSDEIARHESVAPDCQAGPNDLAYVIYTSGSTGRPKGVMVEHGSLCNLLQDMRRRPGLTQEDTLLAVTTLSFDIAGVELYLPLLTGARLVVVDRRTAADGRLLLEALERFRATVMQATPATWRMLVDAGWSGTLGLKALCGGEALPLALGRQLLDRCAQVWNLYGPTEGTIWSTFQRVDRAAEAVSIGRPFANTSVYIVDESLAPVAIGKPGELWIGGVGVARGYLNRPDLTAECFLANPFANGRIYRTGDIARYLPDGRIQFLGRIDNQVKVRGFRIELGEIETALEQRDDVRAAVAVAREQRGEQRLVAYVVPQPGHTPRSSELRRALAQRLPEYMVPAAIVTVVELPLTPNGKVDRKALPDPEPEAEGEAIAPRNLVEARLVEIWERVLGVAPIGIRHNFFDLGTDSLTAARLFVEVEKAFGCRLPLTPVFEAPTIEQLAELVRTGIHSSATSSLVPIQPQGTRPPLFCVHGGAGTILFYHELSRRLGPDQPFYGLQSRGIYGRNSPLRTVEEMAEHYLGELEQIRPCGPYHLVGYCFGGIVAYEMAQRLRERGEEVALLALINAPSPAYIHRHNPWFRSEGDDAPPPPPPPRSRPRRSATALVWPVRKWVHNARFKAYMALGRPLPENWRNGYFVRLAHVAERQYEPRPCPGELLLLRGEGLYVEPDLGWGALVGKRLRSVEIPGQHVIPRDSMSEPRVALVAEQLQQAIRRAGT